VRYANADEREERKELYESILSVVDKHTGDGFSAGMRFGPLVANRTRADYDWRAVEKVIQAATENDDLLQWTDHEGRERITLTDDESLLKVLKEEANHDHPNQGLIARCNKLRTQDK